MIVLVANLGSTSFKYKLFDFAGSKQRVLAVGAADRIGQGNGSWLLRAGDRRADGTIDLADHAAAIDLHLAALVRLGVVSTLDQIDAIGFKAVHGGPVTEAVRVDERVIATMNQFADVAPVHNPPYVAAMQAFQRMLPRAGQVAAFETGFHQTIPMARQVYGIPHQWTESLGIRRYGFHGASHGYIAARMKQISPRSRRIISLHLGGSCSICAIEEGRSVANSFGMTAQSGVFHSSRVGDFDTFALRKLIKAGIDLDTIWTGLGQEGGLLGISGVSPDLREVEQAAASGNERAQLAIDAFVESCRHYVGAYLAVLGGADALTFTGGIGQHDHAIRKAICADLDFAGVNLDDARNAAATDDQERQIDAGRVQVWVLPTNEELIVARQTVEVLAMQKVKA